ncbi:MAG TPA: hypothetical protein VNE41_04505 [Chitinophagaceae bacterium]|nr:hypothetical protein [Chitinophagaceae bacterium]
MQPVNLRVAILDLNAGAPNQGMRSLRNILSRYAKVNDLHFQIEEFEVRNRQEMPDDSFQVYFSTGGPGSPLESQGSSWEKRYFSLVSRLETINSSADNDKKFMFFICHSFQLLCRHYALGSVCKRKSPSFGVLPVHQCPEAGKDPVFAGLPDPFFAVDSREWQVIGPDFSRFEVIGARLLAIEKERPLVPLERALMAIRFSPWFFGTQFHPEADPEGMTHYLETTNKKEQVIEQFGMEKYLSMISQLQDPDKIMLTRELVIPSFLDQAIPVRQSSLPG